jgi:hypothetical protein
METGTAPDDDPGTVFTNLTGSAPQERNDHSADDVEEGVALFLA